MDRARPGPDRRHQALVLVGGVDRRIVPALRLAARLVGADVRAVHVSVDPEATRRLARDWMDLGLTWLPLEVRDGCSERLLDSVQRVIGEEVDRAGEVTVILPEAHGGAWWHGFLHRRTARRIAGELSRDRRVVTVVVPWFGPAPGRRSRVPPVSRATDGVGARP